MTLDAVSGRSYGPIPVAATAGGVAAYVAATGDDPARWQGHAPPGFAAAALFAVAPRFLADPAVAPLTRSVIHSEQAFSWHGPLPVGADVAVTGTVAGVRSRGSLYVVSFELDAVGPEGPWVEGRSSFVLSDRAAAETDEEAEPPHDARGACDPPEPADLPAEGEALPPLARSASRSDLVRYAAATGDWNPIHWDHDAARAAGLPGVVVHGLLMAAWVIQSAARFTPGPDPVRSLTLRFRAPLRPAVPAVVTGSAGPSDRQGASLALALTADGTTRVSASARVTP